MAGYGTDEGLATYLSDNGYVLPDDAPAPAVMRQRGSVYIDGLYNGAAGSRTGLRWIGEPTGGYAQERAWPRSGTVIPDDVIPVAVVSASYEAAFQEASDPGSLTATGSAAGLVKRERVEGAVEVEYQAISESSDLAASLAPVNTTIAGMVRPYLQDMSAESMLLLSIGC